MRRQWGLQLIGNGTIEVQVCACASCIGDHCICLAIVAEPVFAILAAFSNCTLCKHQNNTHHSLSTWGPRLCNESLLHASFACSKANPFTALASHFASNQSHSPLTLIGKGRVYGILSQGCSVQYGSRGTICVLSRGRFGHSGSRGTIHSPLSE